MKQKELEELVSKRLQEIDKKGTKTGMITLRVGVVELSLLNLFCQKVGIKRAKLIRIALDFFQTYLESLSEEEFRKELLKIKRFE